MESVSQSQLSILCVMQLYQLFYEFMYAFFVFHSRLRATYIMENLRFYSHMNVSAKLSCSSYVLGVKQTTNFFINAIILHL